MSGNKLVYLQVSLVLCCMIVLVTKNLKDGKLAYGYDDTATTLLIEELSILIFCYL